MIVKMVAHTINERRMYTAGFATFMTEDATMKALQEAGRNPVLTDIGINFQMDEDELPISLRAIISIGSIA